MGQKTDLVDEIMDAVSKTPLEFQEHLLDIARAMTLTRNVAQENTVENMNCK